MVKKLANKRKEELVIDIIEYLQQHDMFFDINIYANNKRFSTDKHKNDESRTSKHGEYYVSECTKIPVEYNNPNTVTMTFEGPLYDALNYGSGKTEDELQKIFNKYGLYFELGYAWSLAAYV